MKILIALVVVVLIVIVGCGSMVGTRNRLVAEKNQIEYQWAEVDKNLQRRADLIPNLVNTVKGIAQHETEVFGAIANARSALLNARNPQEKIQANSQLDGAIGRLLAVVENYPQLRSNENFLRLQDELAGTENRIAVSRSRYNEAVLKYNTDIEVFPNNIAASVFGFQKNDAYFRADAGARNVPQVKF